MYNHYHNWIMIARQNGRTLIIDVGNQTTKLILLQLQLMHSIYKKGNFKFKNSFIIIFKKIFSIKYK